MQEQSGLAWLVGSVMAIAAFVIFLGVLALVLR